MDQNTDYSTMLELISRPAFIANGTHVLCVNQPAANLLITPQTPLTEWLPSLPEAFSTLTDSCLFLTLHIHGIPTDASVTCRNGEYLFVLDGADTQPQLQAFSLAAKTLRMPLSGAMLAAERLGNTQDASEDFKKDAAALNQHLYQLLRIVCNMSDAQQYAQPQAPSLSLRDATALFGEFFEKAGGLVQQAGMTLRYHGPEEPIPCSLDEEKLERALYNLIANAMKASQKGGILDVELSRRKNHLILSVRDHGEGLHRELLPTVYSRYLRQPGMEDASFGIGLGMVLIRSAAAAHQGTVLIDQPASGGTRVTLTLKLLPLQDAAFHCNPPLFDYAGERDHGLVELSEQLPSHLYEKE